MAQVQSILFHPRETCAMKHPVHHIHRVTGGKSIHPWGKWDWEQTDRGWEQPSATRTALLHPVLSSCKLGERSWSQVQGNAAVPGSGPAVSTATSILQPGPGAAASLGPSQESLSRASELKVWELPPNCDLGSCKDLLWQAKEAVTGEGGDGACHWRLFIPCLNVKNF